MNDKKNIDRFFQEQFKDFEIDPNEQVWINIQTKLKKKKKERRTIPFWIKFPGIAAAFLLGIFALNTLLNTNTSKENSIVLEPKMLKKSSRNNDSIPNNTEKKINSLKIEKGAPILVNKVNTGEKNGKEFTTANESEINSNKETTATNPIVYLQKNHPSIKQKSNNKVHQSHRAIPEKNSTTTSHPFKNIQGQVVEKSTFKENESTLIAQVEPNNQISTSTETPNELEEILKNKASEKQILVLNQKNKWQITPNIGAVYLNSNSGGSPIDTQFSENQKSADNSLSFGIGVNYAMSKKIAIRSGINKLSIGYNTNNVIYSTGLANNNLANINYTTNALIEIKNEAALNVLTSLEKDLQKTNTGALNQKMGYYEVPLELSYTVLDSKLGINIIGGVSTLFLNQNKISLVSDETNLKLGEARNLNQIHFSTNVGLGFKYQIMKSFQINFEPMVKYQLNTFSNNSGDFKPLFIGLYSGISYSF
ncbi:hypothetical protein [Flavobacterium sp. LB2R40]|uniref:hypothetical protein n=1 Tax=Flavobacterium sp. LB2R40 TaxID=3401722 RepID=UPI003AB0E1D5